MINEGRDADKSADSAVTTFAAGIAVEEHDIAIDGLNEGRDAAIDSSSIDDPLLIAMANVDRNAEIFAAAQAHEALQLALPIEFESLVPGGATPTSSLPSTPLPNTIERLADDPGQSWVVYLFDAQPLSGAGHAAVLIGSEEKGWRYFSFSTGEAGWSWAGDLDNLEVRGYQSIAEARASLTPYQPATSSQSYTYDSFAAWKIAPAGVPAGRTAAMTFLEANYQIAGRNCDDLAVCTIEAAGVTDVVDALRPSVGFAANSEIADLFGQVQPVESEDE